MVGLQNSSNIKVMLNQWHELFINQSAFSSEHSYSNWNDVKRLGLLSCEDEYWKHVPFNKLLAHQFVTATSNTVLSSVRDRLSLTLDAYRIVFVNGRFISTLSDVDIGFWKIQHEIGSSRQSLPDPIQSEMFLHLTESLSKETTLITLPAGQVEQRPLYLLHISQGISNQEILSVLHYRHHIDMQPGSHGQIIEHFTSVDDYSYFSGARTTMMVGDNSCLNHITLALEGRSSYNFRHNDIVISNNAVVRSSTFLLGKGFVRHQTSVQLNNEGADLEINSLLLPSEGSVIDNRTYLVHNAGYCISRQKHKIIARDHSKGIFSGMIKVENNALRTDGNMMVNSLLLNESAEIYVTPQLEIYADDVKCSHSATVGQIDEEQMFYLRSRGIVLQEAEQIIVYAFMVEAMGAVNCSAVQDEVILWITQAVDGVAI